MPDPTATAQAPENNKPKQSAYLVCDGALCQCSAGAAPVKLKVTSHKKAYINADKLVATEKDITFDQPGHFGTCSFKPPNSNACVPAVQQWMKPYKDIEVENQKAITDKSELLCSVGGKIVIKMHGQQQSVNAGQAENMDRTIAAQVNPLADLAPIAETDKKVKVISITGELVDDPKYKVVTTQPNKSTISITDKEIEAKKKIEDPADIYVRPGQEIKFTAKYDGTDSLVCWKISSTKDPVHFLQHGATYKSSFEELGKYTIEGYGSGGDSNPDVDTKVVNGEEKERKEDKTCMLDILVQNNKLTGIRHLESKNIIPGKVDNKTGVHVRIGVPVTFEPVYLMPPIQEEIDHLILVIKDASGNEVQRSKGAPNIVFAAQNSAANYKVEAYFDNSEATPFTYPFRTSHNTVSVIAASGMQSENEKIRPGKTLTFSASKLKYSADTVEEELLAVEYGKIKWYENSEVSVGTGQTYANTYNREGKYIVKCAVTTVEKTWFTKGKDDTDDWRFEVTNNYPTAIEQKTAGKAKVGKKMTFELKGIFAIDYSDAATITWQLTGPETITTTRSYAFVFTPRKNGSYKLTATMHGRTVNFPFECIACEIVKGWWTDADGNILTVDDDEPTNTIGFAGWDQEVVAAFKHVGLNGEDVTIEVWDKDSSGSTSVFKKDIKVSDSYTVDTCSIKLDQKIKDKVKEKGWSEDGSLYFTVKAKNGLKVINDGMVLPDSDNYLDVDSTVRIKMYFADNNDKRRYSTAALDTPVFVQVKSTNLIGEELEMETWEWGYVYHNALGNRTPFKVDKYGMASVKLSMEAIKDKLPNPNDSIQIFVKVFNKKTGKEYTSSSATYKLTLYKTLSKPSESSETTKAFVLVDASKLDKKECECKLNNFAWGNKLTCQERKKILSICSKLWGDANKVERANELMSIIHLESAGTFNPSVDNGAGYSGLIQFSDAAAKSVGTTRVDLKKMSFLQQLDYVEKYFTPHKEKLKTITDLYLLVLKPSAVGNGINPDYIIFDESVSVPNVPYNKDNLYKEPWTTKYGYTSNPTFMLEKDESVKRLHMTYSKGEVMRPGFINGKTYVKEITEVLNEQHLIKGKSHTFSGFCEDETKNRNDISLKNRAAWMSIAVSKAIEAKGCKEGESPMYSMAKEYLKYCGNTFEPTDSDNGPWCAAFMNWCIGQSINPLTKTSYEHSKSASSLAPIDAVLGLKYKKIDDPIFGCIVVYKHISDWKGHTGFLYGKTEAGDYILLGGNQDDTIRFDSYGEYTSSTNKKKIYGFYIPNDYEITDYDKLTAEDTYKDAEVVNSKYKISSTQATGKTN